MPTKKRRSKARSKTRAKSKASSRKIPKVRIWKERVIAKPVKPSTYALRRGRPSRCLFNRHGLSYGELAVLTGLKRNYVSRALMGKFIPAIPTLYILCQELGISMHDYAVRMQMARRRLKDQNSVQAIQAIHPSVLAEVAGCHPSHITRIRSGAGTPSLALVAVLADYYRVTVDTMAKALGCLTADPKVLRYSKQDWAHMQAWRQKKAAQHSAAAQGAIRTARVSGNTPVE